MTYAGVNALGQEVSGEFVVFTGSTARKVSTPSLSDSYRQMRQELLNEGKLADSSNSDYWIFTQNIPFTSPSAAANVVAGAL